MEMESEIKYEKVGNKYKKIHTVTCTMTKKEIEKEKENFGEMNLNLDGNIKGIEETKVKNNKKIKDIEDLL